MEIVSPPKVNKPVLTYNEAHEFTRRKPTFLTNKQQERDTKIVMQIARAHDVDEDADKLLDIFFSKCKFLSDPVYWEVLRSVWVACGSTELAAKFRPYFLSKRRARSWFMTVEDAAALDSMQFPIQLWRAYDDDDDPGISWTRDYQWCQKYAEIRGRQIKTAVFNRSDIYAYISRRGEEEFLIL